MQRIKPMVIIFLALGVISLVLLFYYFGAFYPAFNKLNKNKEFQIPGLKENFVPQGFEYVGTRDLFLVSGYMSDGNLSRIYVVDRKTGTAQKYVTIEGYFGHAGGIATNGTHVWVVGDKKLLTLSLADLLEANNGDALAKKSEIITGNGCDFVKVYNNTLVVGEFYRAKKYETQQAHHITHQEGDTTYALAYCYSINNEKTSGIEELPSFALTLPNHAQGIAFVGQKIVVSTSWSVPSSKLIIYSNPLGQTSTQTVSLNGQTVPLYCLNKGRLEKEVKAPAMSEELCVVGDRVYIMFESASNKYKFFNRTRTKNAISIKI